MRTVEAFLIGFIMGGLVVLGLFFAQKPAKPVTPTPTTCCDEYLDHIRAEHPEYVRGDQ